MKTSKKVLAVLLTIATLIGIFSCATPVFAEEVVNAEETQALENSSETSESAETEIDDETEENESDEPEVLNEIVELRNENTKYFRNSDGSYTAAQYAYPVHYKENGEWKEIDNTLTEENVKGNLVGTENEFVSKKTNTPVKFPEAFQKNSSNEITVSTEGYEISFSPKTDLNTFKSSEGTIKETDELESVKITEKFNELQRGKITASNGTKETAEVKLTQELNTTQKIETADGIKSSVTKENNKYEKFKVANKSSAVVYENVFNNANLEYELNNSEIKESIVVNKKRNNYVFEFNMDFGGLYPIVCPNGSINLCSDENGENPIAKIEAPYMIDSVGEYSDLVEMTIEPKGEEYVLIVTADESWLNDKSRIFPVVIDPTIRLDINAAHTYDCYVDDSTPNKAKPYNTNLLVGNNSLGKTRTFVKFDLPDLPGDNYLITNATVIYHQYEIDAGDFSTQYMSIHKVIQDWDNANYNVTWNNQPDFEEDIVLDYAKFEDTNAYSYKFDVTRTVKEWYEGAENYGFALKLKNENASKRAALVSAEHPVNDLYPEIYVTFLDNKGLESYWSYSSYSIGSAGNAYINDYTGNLVYELPILSSVSQRAPLTLTAYFNNYCATQPLTAGKSNSSRTTIGKGFRLNIQQTVLPSTKYGLSGSNAESYPYVYTDADGTEHFLVKETEDGKTVYKDQEGLGLTMKTQSDITESGIIATYQITDKAHNNYFFNSEGNLGIIQDKNGNRITIDFVSASANDNFRDKTRISKITDGAGHTFTFHYYNTTTGNYVAYIEDDAGRRVSFTTSEGYLNEISYYDETKTVIVYENATEGIINYIQSNGIYRLNFDYTSKAIGRRVNKVKEYGVTSTKNSEGNTVYSTHNGQVVTFDRTKYNTTVIRSCGMDRIHGNNDDIITTLQFDNSGRAVSQQMKYGSGTGIVAGSVEYTSASGDNNTNGFNNRIGASGSLGKNIENLLCGGNAESLDYWATAKTGDVTCNYSFDQSQQYMGKSSILLENTSISTNGGKSYFRQNYTGFSYYGNYTLSAYVKTEDLESVLSTTRTGAYIQLIAYNSAGDSVASATSSVISQNTDIEINNGWERLTVSLAVPDTAISIRCYLMLNNVRGKAFFDCIQLENSSVANSYNMLENGSFEKYDNSTKKLTAWTKASDMYETSTDDGASDSSKKHGSISVKMNGSADASKGIYQTISVQPNPNDTYIVGGWARGYPINGTYHTHYEKNGVTISDEDAEKILTNTDKEDDKTIKIIADAKFEIAVRVTYIKTDSDGKTKEVTQYKDSAKFNTTITGWQYSSTPIELKYTDGEAGCTYTPTKLTIMPRFNKQENHVFFDHLMLVKEPTQTYTYDKDGNLVATTANSEQKVNLEYDNNNLTSYTDTLNNKTTLKYNDKNNLVSLSSAGKVHTEYTYNSSGLLRTTEVHDGWVSTNSQKEGYIAPTMAIKTGQTYFDDNSSTDINEGAFINAVYDENKNATSYTYDYNSGKILTATDPNGVVTTNTYGVNYGKLNSTTVKSSRVYYNYDDANRINYIKFGKVTNGSIDSKLYEKYSFVYDNYGNIAQTLVGSQPLSINTYYPYNGALKLTTYGNGDTVSYDYTNLGNLKSQSHNGTECYSWNYNASGVLLSHLDKPNDSGYNYVYDSLGRLVKKEITNYAGNEYIGYIEQGFDKRNNVNKLTTNFGGVTHTQKYSYNTTGKNDNSSEYKKDNLPTYYQIYSSRYAIYDYDGLNRLIQRDFSTEAHLFYNYTYKSSDRNTSTTSIYTTSQIQDEYIGDDVYTYTYGNRGNLIGITKGERATAGSSTTAIKTNSQTAYRSYKYDDLGQLTRENNNTNNKTTLWTYDDLGNITTKSEYAYTTGTVGTPTKTVAYYYKEEAIPYEEKTEATKTYSSWNNLLLAIDRDGSKKITDNETIEYDEIGNPTTYLGATLTWNGRRLKSYKTDSRTVKYMYDSDGLRASKTVDGVKTSYYYAGTQLAYQKSSDGNKLYFFYDSNGYLTGVEYNGTNYYTATNLKGDVVAIYDRFGVCVAKYEYDAWGNVISVIDCDFEDEDGNIVKKDITNDTTSTDIAMVNPIRYRGYYYDSETELYYLQSRYYNAEVGRFLNADGYITTGQGVLSYNMFAYCGNNPIRYIDPTGRSFTSWLENLYNKVDNFINDMCKSDNRIVAMIGSYCRNKFDEKTHKTDIERYDKIFKEQDRVIEQYTKDAISIGQNGTLTDLPNPVYFSDVEAYKERCLDGYGYMQKSYLKETIGTTYNAEVIAQDIGSWDFMMCCTITFRTCDLLFTEMVKDVGEMID